MITTPPTHRRASTPKGCRPAAFPGPPKERPGRTEPRLPYVIKRILAEHCCGQDRYPVRGAAAAGGRAVYENSCCGRLTPGWGRPAWRGRVGRPERLPGTHPAHQPLTPGRNSRKRTRFLPGAIIRRLGMACYCLTGARPISPVNARLNLFIFLAGRLVVAQFPVRAGALRAYRRDAAAVVHSARNVRVAMTGWSAGRAGPLVWPAAALRPEGGL